MNNLIRFKPKYMGNHRLYCQHFIFYRNTKIGEISFIKKNGVFVIGYLGVFTYYQGQHYGYQIIEYILSHYKTKCIIGQSLYRSRTFWNKCIERFNGQRKNISTLDNCTSSFIIPKYDIKREIMIELLELGHEIE